MTGEGEIKSHSTGFHPAKRSDKSQGREKTAAAKEQSDLVFRLPRSISNFICWNSFNFIYKYNLHYLELDHIFYRCIRIFLTGVERIVISSLKLIKVRGGGLPKNTLTTPGCHSIYHDSEFQGVTVKLAIPVQLVSDLHFYLSDDYVHHYFTDREVWRAVICQRAH